MEDLKSRVNGRRAAVEDREGVCVTVTSGCKKRAINLIRCFQHGGGGVKGLEYNLPSIILWFLACFLAFCNCLYLVPVSGW